jgi:UDP-N-acetylglucosamine diphosphorylase / glucose-1-phosphate thymidylyltransferase / UDP-N-acetylgalactosamine diphosphorylase / glucosamine-1-phosphate N-acetyltransferase / galactosamine-1-phosphate N-acetyltransferase
LSAQGKKISAGESLHLYMPFILFDPADRSLLSPLSDTKAFADLRFGILSVKERWELLLGDEAVVETVEYLEGLYRTETVDLRPDRLDAREKKVVDSGQWVVESGWLKVNASYIPTNELIDAIEQLKPNQYISYNNAFVAGIPSAKNFFGEAILFSGELKQIVYPWDIIFLNDAQIRADFKWVTKGKKSMPLSPTVRVIQLADIFIEEGTKLEFCTLNSTTGPIYIGKHAEIMEGSSVRGPFSLGEMSVLKMNSRIYGGTSLGSYCMGGGEIKNAIMMGYSNKAHDGYLGDAVIGEWCNFGAGTTNSNVKNGADVIKIWTMGDARVEVVVGQKCGVIVGDYTRFAINSSINTGSMVGVSANVFGAGLLPKEISHFSWGTTGKRYNFERAIGDINNWKKMKGKLLTDAERKVLEHIFQQSN